MMQTMMDPHLLPCGHIADKPTLDQLVRKECFLDRVPFRRADLIHFMPHITKLEKISKKAFLSSTSPSSSGSSSSSSSSLDPPSPGTSSATSSPSIQGARKHSLKPAGNTLVLFSLLFLAYL
jgi:hypothetical protein